MEILTNVPQTNDLIPIISIIVISVLAFSIMIGSLLIGRKNKKNKHTDKDE